MDLNGIKGKYTFDCDFTLTPFSIFKWIFLWKIARKQFDTRSFKWTSLKSSFFGFYAEKLQANMQIYLDLT